MKSEHKTKNKTRRKKNATQKNGVPRFFRETPFDLALFNYINLSAVVFSCKIFVKFCSLSKLQVVFDIAEDISKLGYANTLYMNLNVSKLKALGWNPTVNMKHMFKNMIDAL